MTEHRILTCTADQVIEVGGCIKLSILRCREGSARISISAPDGTSIRRGHLVERPNAIDRFATVYEDEKWFVRQRRLDRSLYLAIDQGGSEGWAPLLLIGQRRMLLLAFSQEFAESRAHWEQRQHGDVCEPISAVEAERDLQAVINEFDGESRQREELAYVRNQIVDGQEGQG